MKNADKEEKNLQPDDGAVEISDLPPETESHFLLLKLVAWKKRLLAVVQRLRSGQRSAQQAQHSRRARRVRGRQVLAVCALLAALGILLLGNIIPLRTPLLGLLGIPTPTHSATETNTVSSVNSMVQIIQGYQDATPPISSGPQTIGVLPNSCPKASELQLFNTPLDPPGMGSGPVWLTGFTGPTAALTRLQKVQSPIDGWYTTLTLFVAKGFKGTLIIDGWGQDMEGLLFFNTPGTTRANTPLTINLDSSNEKSLSSNGSWETMPLNIYFLIAGCYSLRAYWGADSWVSYFAVGR